MPYLEESSQSDHASDSVFTDTEASTDPHSSPSNILLIHPFLKIQLFYQVLQSHLHQEEVLEAHGEHPQCALERS